MDISSELADIARPGRSGGGNDDYGHHIFGSVVGYKIHDNSTERNPNHADRVIIDMQRPGAGIDASPEAPVRVEVTIDAPKPPAAGTKKPRTPLAVYHVANGRGTAKETLVGDFVMFKDVKRQPDGSFAARRAEVGVRSFDAQQHYIYSGLFSIRPERERKNPAGEPYMHQERIGLLTPLAIVVNSVEDVEQAALQALVDAQAHHGARPYFVLRGIQENEKGKHHFSIAREIGLWDFENRRPLEMDEAIKRFVSGDDGNNGPRILSYLGNPAIKFEVIPQLRVNTGNASLPSSRRQAAEENNKYDPNNDRNYDEGVDQRFMEAQPDGSQRMETGYSMMDVVLQRRPSNERPGEWGRTHTIFTQPQRKIQPLFKLAQVPSPNLSDSLNADLVALGRARSKAVFDASKAKDAPKSEAPAGNDQDDAYAPPGMSR